MAAAIATGSCVTPDSADAAFDWAPIIGHFDSRTTRPGGVWGRYDLITAFNSRMRRRLQGSAAGAAAARCSFSIPAVEVVYASLCFAGAVFALIYYLGSECSVFVKLWNAWEERGRQQYREALQAELRMTAAMQERLQQHAQSLHGDAQAHLPALEHEDYS